MERSHRVRYEVDRMAVADIPRVAEIEKLTNQAPWPSSTYYKELQENPMAHYLVLRDRRLAETLRATGSPATSAPRRPFPLSLLPGAHSSASLSPEVGSVIGFAGLWLMVDEAHITIIATHPAYRRRGLGELLLSSLITTADQIHANSVTLEVRYSNAVAQNLYHKYGFIEAGLRKRYYSDNNEDAKIMWIHDIHDPAYRTRFTELTTALRQRLAAQEDEVGAISDPAGGQAAPPRG